ncbi:MAG TPA: 4-hydroxy-tetrahydrodipicolinate reductase [Steroidobacteraceae bacterium]|nr:4-hydroxy-tetrahydrodipicolinate reductase [Steroidobacteraceae bacterium]
MSALRVLVIGIAGRMGQALVRVAGERSDLAISAGLARAGSPYVGVDAGTIAGVGPLGLIVREDLTNALAECDAVLDFSEPTATAANLAACCAAGKPLLIGTSGLTADVRHELERVARHIPLLIAPNTSLAVTLLLELAREAARVLPLAFDAEIIESHHRGKKDAPSGTALALGQAIAEGRGLELEQVGVRGRAGSGPRREGEIGFAALRGGDVVGEHSVVFAGIGEQLILAHRATDRAIFARGALDAIVWLARQPPGRYAMRDLLLKQ